MATGVSVTAQDVWVMAQTIWGEARGEPVLGQRAVAAVIWNRAQHGQQSLTKVCKQPYQFSCWLPSDPNRKLLEGLTPVADAVFAACLHLAVDCVAGKTPSPVGKARWFHATWMEPPSWAASLVRVRRIGGHIFYAERG